MVRIYGVGRQDVANSCQAKALHPISERSANPRLLVRNTQTKGQYTHRPDDGREQYGRKTVLWLSDSRVAPRHVVGDQIDQFSAHKNGEQCADQARDSEKTQIVNLPVIRWAQKDNTAFQLDDNVPVSL